MKMDDQGESENVEDVRGSSGGGFRPIHGIGLGSIALAIIGGLIFHVNPLELLGLMSGGDQSSTQSAHEQPIQSPPAGDPDAKFVSQVLRSTETVWTAAFQERGLTYTDPKLRLFRDSYPTACGQGSAAAGPFYCAQDQVVYLGLGFFYVMTQQLGAPGPIRPRLRHWPRGGASCSESAGHPGKNKCTPGAQQRCAGKRAQRSPGIAGGLFRGGLGRPFTEGTGLASRVGGNRIGPECRPPNRGRYPSTASARHGRSGDVHARYERTTSLVVQAWRLNGSD